MKVYIDYRIKINYASYYVYGLRKVFGKKNVFFDLLEREDPNFYSDIHDYDKGMAIILEDANLRKKIFIDFHDGNGILDKFYNWADLYAKINISENDLKKYPKLLPIGPSFGINIFDFSSIVNLLKLLFIRSKPVTLKNYFKDYLYMPYRRLRFDNYQESTSSKNYIFSISTLWYDSLTDETTNKNRAHFMRLCSKKFDLFEGGFYYIGNDNVYNEFPKYKSYLDIFKDLITKVRISPANYLIKTKKSTVVFNTPSVSGCHGWKLAEYFSLGKFIISTPLNNLMPGNFENALVSVDKLDDIEKILDNVIANEDYKKQLERNSITYFQEFLSPNAVIKRIVDESITSN